MIDFLFIYFCLKVPIQYQSNIPNEKSFKIFIKRFYELLLFENILIFVHDKGMIYRINNNITKISHSFFLEMLKMIRNCEVVKEKNVFNV